MGMYIDKFFTQFHGESNMHASVSYFDYRRISCIGAMEADTSTERHVNKEMV